MKMIFSKQGITLRRVIGAGLIAAVLYAILIGAGAAAQDSSSDPSSQSSTSTNPQSSPSTSTDTSTSGTTGDSSGSAGSTTTDPSQSEGQNPSQTPDPGSGQSNAQPDPATSQPADSGTTPPASSDGTATTPSTSTSPLPSTPSTQPTPTTPSCPTRENGKNAKKDKASKDRKKGSDRSKDSQRADKNGKSQEGNKDCKGKPADPKKDKKDKKNKKNPKQTSDNSPAKDKKDQQATKDPFFSIGMPGITQIGIPSTAINNFDIPPFLLPIYQAAGTEYNIPWEALAAINQVETNFGRNLSTSSAGAMGWMQFMPGTWKQYGVDANGDGVKDPYNPADAIFAAARYLNASGGDQDLNRAILSYNHAGWYVQMVLERMQAIAGIPAGLIGSLTGLTEGRFPVYGSSQVGGTSAHISGVGTSLGARVGDGIEITAKAGSPVIATNNAKVIDLGHNKQLGNFIRLQDAYGNKYTYGKLGSLADVYPTPKAHGHSESKVTNSSQRRSSKLPFDPKLSEGVDAKESGMASRQIDGLSGISSTDRPPSTLDHHGAQTTNHGPNDKAQFAILNADPQDFQFKPLEKGVELVAGTILGEIGRPSAHSSAGIQFEIQPSGDNAPQIDPKPILDGWKLLEKTALFRGSAKGKLLAAGNPSVGQTMLMNKNQLAQEVLSNSRIQIYPCGRTDIATGQIDRRVLATLEILADSGLRPTVSSLRCGHSLMTTSGNVSEHSYGSAVDISEINGIPILGHQGPGSIADTTIRRLLALQGSMKPHQIISLMTYAGTDNTFAMADHANHIHVGFQPDGVTTPGGSANGVIKPEQWIKLVERLNKIDNPSVPSTSDSAKKVGSGKRD